MYSFTHNHYKEILQLALEKGYSFVSFNEVVNSNNNKFCLLRHDVDADLIAALKMARIENELGIRSTYFFMLRSPLYNLFSRDNYRMALEIIRLGHFVGLHFDEGFVEDKTQTEEIIRKELKILSVTLDTEITIFSVHQPSEEMIKNPIRLKNIINTYDFELFKDIFYLSDSNMTWKSHLPEEVFEKELFRKIQLLVHPMWWVGDGNQNTKQLWNKAIKNNHIMTMNQLISTERAFGEPRYFDFGNE